MLKTREEYIINDLPSDITGAELGVFRGDFSEILYHTRKFKKLFLVDIFSGRMDSGDKNGRNIQVLNLDDEYSRLLDFYRPINNVKLVKSRTDHFLKSLDDNFLDFVYIDVDHSYSAVKGDLSLSRYKVKSGGIIAGHDYNQKSFPGVVQAVDEFIAEHGLSMETTTEDELASYFIINTK